MMDGSGARSAEDWNNQSGSQHGCVEEGGTRPEWFWNRIVMLMRESKKRLSARIILKQNSCVEVSESQNGCVVESESRFGCVDDCESQNGCVEESESRFGCVDECESQNGCVEESGSQNGCV